MSAGITVGKVLAGAGVAVGAVMLCVAAGISGDSVGQFFKDIGDKLAGLFNLPTGFEVGKNVPTTLIGAGLAGGGLALYSSMNRREEDLRDARVDDQPAPGGFAEAEQIRAMQGIMKARMAMASPEHMMADGRGL